MANERQRASDVTPDDFDKRTVDRWPVDSVHVPFTVTDEVYAEMAKRSRGAVHWPAHAETGTYIYDVAVYGDPLDWQTLIGGVRGCIGTP